MILEELSFAIVAASHLVALYADLKMLVNPEIGLRDFTHVFQLSIKQLFFGVFRSTMSVGAFVVAGLQAKLSGLWFVFAGLSATVSIAAASDLRPCSVRCN